MNETEEVKLDNDRKEKIKKLLSLSKEEIDKIISNLTLDELEMLLDAMNEVK